jgi:hypothetical protein
MPGIVGSHVISLAWLNADVSRQGGDLRIGTDSRRTALDHARGVSRQQVSATPGRRSASVNGSPGKLPNQLAMIYKVLSNFMGDEALFFRK